MPGFGRRSLARLETVVPELAVVCHEVIRVRDFTVLCGRRGKDEQAEAFATGHSTVIWPNSRHNVRDPDDLASAVDIAPWFDAKPHIRWDHEREFVYLAGHILQAADALGVELRWGGDWDRDGDLYDRNKPFDLVHFEVRK